MVVICYNTVVMTYDHSPLVVTVITFDYGYNRYITFITMVITAITVLTVMTMLIYTCFFSRPSWKSSRSSPVAHCFPSSASSETSAQSFTKYVDMARMKRPPYLGRNIALREAVGNYNMDVCRIKYKCHCLHVYIYIYSLIMYNTCVYIPLS